MTCCRKPPKSKKDFKVQSSWSLTALSSDPGCEPPSGNERWVSSARSAETRQEEGPAKPVEESEDAEGRSSDVTPLSNNCWVFRYASWVILKLLESRSTLEAEKQRMRRKNCWTTQTEQTLTFRLLLGPQWSLLTCASHYCGDVLWVSVESIYIWATHTWPQIKP